MDEIGIWPRFRWTGDACYDAVRAACSLLWSNGTTEGHVNRLKILKRQMFGRAHLDLLRVKVLHAI
jgi:transposase